MTKTHLFSNFAWFCTHLNDVRTYIYIAWTGHLNYVLFFLFLFLFFCFCFCFFFTRMISNFIYKCPPPPDYSYQCFIWTNNLTRQQDRLLKRVTRPVLLEQQTLPCKPIKLGNGERRGTANTSFPGRGAQWNKSTAIILFIHSLVVCSDLGDLPKFCSENLKKQKTKKTKKKTGKWLCLLFCTLIEQRMKIRSRADVK